MSSSQIITVETDDFCVRLEWTGARWMSHCDVFHWSPATAKKLLSSIGWLARSLEGDAVIARNQNPRFLTWLGFSPTEEEAGGWKIWRLQ